MPKGHRENCICFICKAKRHETKHQQNCLCSFCKMKRKEPHLENCTCYFCEIAKDPSKVKRGVFSPTYKRKHTEAERILMRERSAPHKKKDCQCMTCKIKRNEPHKNDCKCIACVNKRKEPHRTDCQCFKCKLNRGEQIQKHRTNCTCYFCKSRRRENIGSKNGMFNKHHSMESRKKISNTLIYGSLREQRIKNILRANSAKPNRFEYNALVYLNIIYDNKFEYTGNGTLIINGRSADAYAKALNTIALFNGVYWHLKQDGYEINAENKRIVEKIEAKPFLDAGYKVIFIWEDELKYLIKNNRVLKQKIKEMVDIV